LSNLSTTLAAQQDAEPGPQPLPTTGTSEGVEQQAVQSLSAASNQEQAALPLSLAAFETTEAAAAAGFATGLAAGMAAGIAAWEAAIAEASARQQEFAVHHHPHVHHPAEAVPEHCREAITSTYGYQPPPVAYPVEASMPASYQARPATSDVSKSHVSSTLNHEVTTARILHHS